MIPITFNKDDSLNLKKGNIRGQDLASIISFGLPKVAGILNIWNNPVSVISNVTGTGYSTFTMSKGYIVVYGRLIYVEQGEQVQVALPSSGTVNGVFGVRINLGQTGSQEVTWFTKTSELQVNKLLNDEVNGIYEFGIYNYTATRDGITLGTKIAPIINKTIDEVNTICENLSNEVQEQVEILNNDIATKISGTETILFTLDRGSYSIFGEYDIPDISSYKYIEIRSTHGSDNYVDTVRFSLLGIEDARNKNRRLRISGTSNFVKFNSNTRVFISTDKDITIIGVK